MPVFVAPVMRPAPRLPDAVAAATLDYCASIKPACCSGYRESWDVAETAKWVKNDVAGLAACIDEHFPSVRKVKQLAIWVRVRVYVLLTL